MIKKMLINATDPQELRVALVADGRLEAFHVETAAREQTRGNIYKALVVNVEPSLQAAFLDYGAPRHGFLQITDLRPDLYPPGKAPERGLPHIQDVLKKGQEILVQVVKEETGTKGASLTTFFSIPGQSLVLTVGREGRGVSRKLESDAERDRLKDILAEAQLPPLVGIIARTASEGRSKRDLQANCRLLLKVWDDIQKRGQKAKAPALIHREEELAVRAVRDLFTSDVAEIVVDDSEVFARVRDFLALTNPRRKDALKLHREKRPIFARHDIEDQLESVYQPTVRLNCGGSIVIQPTEALVSVDVNSGKAIRGGDIEATALNVNQEAAQEIARQLRLRDLGGLIVIDFIDMRDRKHQAQVQKVLKEELKKDKAKITLGRLSRFGLLELSRQRIRPPIDFGATRACPVCQGRGLVRTLEALARGALRSIGPKMKGFEGGVRARLAPEIASYLQNARRAELLDLEAEHGVSLEVFADPHLGLEEVRLERAELSWSPPQRSVPPEPQPVEPAAEARPEHQPAEPAAPSLPGSQAKPKSRSRSRKRRPGKSSAQAGSAPQAGSATQPEAGPPSAQTEPGEGPSGGEPGEAGKTATKRRRPRRRSGASRRRARKAASQNGAENVVVAAGEPSAD